VKTGADGSQRQRERLRELGVRELGAYVEQQEIALVLTELPQRVGERLGYLEPRERPFVWLERSIPKPGERAEPPLLTAMLIPSEVDRNPVQPSAGVRDPKVVGAAAAECDSERLRGQVFRAGTATSDEEPIQRRVMSLEQPKEGITVVERPANHVGICRLHP
jgi:hypothetical protein